MHTTFLAKPHEPREPLFLRSARTAFLANRTEPNRGHPVLGTPQGFEGSLVSPSVADSRPSTGSHYSRHVEFASASRRACLMQKSVYNRSSFLRHGQMGP